MGGGGVVVPCVVVVVVVVTGGRSVVTVDGINGIVEVVGKLVDVVGMVEPGLLVAVVVVVVDRSLGTLRLRPLVELMMEDVVNAGVVVVPKSPIPLPGTAVKSVDCRGDVGAQHDPK